MTSFERCKKYKPSVDRICELDLVDRFLWCDGCAHFKQPDDCLKVQRTLDRDKFLELLGSFPPYHGEGWNYTKQEVEEWLAKAKKVMSTHFYPATSSPSGKEAKP